MTIDKQIKYLKVTSFIVALLIAMVIGAIVDRVIVNRKLEKLAEILKAGDVKALKSWQYKRKEQMP